MGHIEVICQRCGFVKPNLGRLNDTFPFDTVRPAFGNKGIRKEILVVGNVLDFFVGNKDSQEILFEYLGFLVDNIVFEELLY